jgi:hypothetical protein
MIHTCNLSVQQAKAGKSQVGGKPGLCRKALSQKEIRKLKVDLPQV